MSTKQTDEKSIFKAALELQTPTERAAYVDGVCTGDPALKARILALLEAREDKGDFLEAILDKSVVSLNDGELKEKPGTVIDKYKLLEKIGEGGMAVVYMAQQEEPIKRKVALKIIKLGMDTKSVIARFEAERQALAMMDHPNIAKVLDAGATETGRPYFVMELVQGVSITEYCDKNELNTRERLALFVQVCSAIQHAHQKGIIHRDIKPSNVMVTQREGEPIPKVIDFGIAKAISQRLTEKTLFTRYAHIIGTPAYMSPEQAQLSDLDIDTRSDVYSLGVLLYELLTGAQPFSEEELRKSGYLEMQRVIREEEPAKPSAKLSTLGPAVTDVAKYRRATPDLLRKAISGDLDWIVMKSLEKNRTRRYETANGLAMDIRRHLAHEPVVARGPSTTYRLQKFLRRNRVSVAAALALVVVVAVVGIILSGWKTDRRQLAKDKSFRETNTLSQAQESYAKGQLAEALRQAGSILDSEVVGSEAQLLYANILVEGREPNEATARLEELLHESPEIAGAAHALLARVLWESPSTDAEKRKKVDEHRQRAEELVPKKAEAYFLRAMTAMTIKEKFELLDEALRLDPGHYGARRLRAFTFYASRKYEEMERDALVMIALRPPDPLGHRLHAIAWHQLGLYEDAIEAYDSAIKLTPQEDPQYVDMNARRCDALMAMGQYDRVITDARQCLEVVADGTPLQFRIFCALTAQGNYEDAGSLFWQVADSDPSAGGKLRDWSRKYVFDRLVAGQPWHPSESGPEGAAFVPMLEAQRTFRNLSTKARRVVTDAFTAHWSPDGTKLAFSTGFLGYSGVAVWDAETEETDLLIVPGKDPRLSPDGRYLAFVRDCQALPVSELAGAERENRHRASEDEEVWIMNADGTEPRRLASGGWPCWSRDPNYIYFHSHNDGAICKMPIEGTNAKPQKVLKCSDTLPEISPDNNYVACLEGNSMKILELASGSVFAELTFPSWIEWGKTWSSNSRELCFYADEFDDVASGLWVYDMDKRRTSKVLKGPVHPRSLAPDGTKLTFNLPSPYFEIWAADLDPNAGIVGSLGSDLILEEHLQEKLALHTQRIEANPEDANNYFLRAQFHGRLGERALANADMKRWSAVVSGRQPTDSLFAGLADSSRVLRLPFDCQLVLSAERPLNTIPIMSVAFGQKGRCKMKLFKIPMFVTSLFGLGLLSGLGTPAVQADYVLGTPINLGQKVNSTTDDVEPSISDDGLELYFTSYRPGGHGDGDIWVAKRVATDAEWEEPTNLGHLINSSAYDGGACLSPDGLSLYFVTLRGSGAVMVTRRESRSENWGTPEIAYPIWEWGGKAFPSISSDNLEMYICEYYVFDPDGFGLSDLWVSTRSSDSDAWNAPQNLGPIVNSPAHDRHPSISADGLALFFSSDRPGGYGDYSAPIDKQDIWVTTRAGKNDDWGTPMNLGPMVNTSASDNGPSISADGQTLYFSSRRPGGHGGYDLWQAPIEPTVDFNGDGEVNHLDLGMLIISWGTNNSLYDIGPTPLGDGIVDSRDLMVLAEHGAMLCGDVNYDGVVDLFDLAELSRNWLQQQP